MASPTEATTREPAVAIPPRRLRSWNAVRLGTDDQRRRVRIIESWRARLIQAKARARGHRREALPHVTRSMQQGVDPTPQRVAVFEFLSAVQSHPTAEQIHQAVCERLAGTSLATIYNSLDALIESGLAVKIVGSDGVAHFDARTEAHYHVRDVESGEIRDLPVEFDPALLSKLDGRLDQHLAEQGLEVAGYRLEVLARKRK